MNKTVCLRAGQHSLHYPLSWTHHAHVGAPPLLALCSLCPASPRDVYQGLNNGPPYESMLSTNADYSRCPCWPVWYPLRTPVLAVGTILHIALGLHSAVQR